eukprot:TRINITY_DN727_c0_g1_i3.p1 TRINITY_DN727_c0_g1~~TRINITY_DN727_c0_g1_i3.p1  ORF type:complete len:676 (+),score=133.47 TRINITY_DN727_c0_g1_i3:122-2149(+)
MPTPLTVTGQSLLRGIKDPWKLAPVRGDHSREFLKLNGAFIGQLMYEADGVVQHTYDVVLAVQLHEDGRVSGRRYAADEQGTRLPDATIDPSSTWRKNKANNYISLKLQMTQSASMTYAASSFVVEGFGVPDRQTITTVTWRMASRAYHRGSDFKWVASDIAQAQIAANAKVYDKEPNAAGFTDAPMGGACPSPPPNPGKAGSQVVSSQHSDRERNPALGIFVSEDEKRKAMNYQMKYGCFPPEIEERMAKKGIGKGDRERDRAQVTWNKIKETFDATRARGGDGTVPSTERNTRISNWLARVEPPTPEHDPFQPLDRIDRAAPREPPPLKDLVASRPPPAPRAGMPPLHPSTAAPKFDPQPLPAMLPPSWQQQPGMSPSWPAPSPTYGGVAGLSPHPNSVAADMGDETPAYGELLAGTSPGYGAGYGQSPGYGAGYGQSPGYGVSPNRPPAKGGVKDASRPPARRGGVMSLLRGNLSKRAPTNKPPVDDAAWDGRPRTPKKPSKGDGDAGGKPGTPQTSPQDAPLDPSKLPPPPPREQPARDPRDAHPPTEERHAKDRRNTEPAPAARDRSNTREADQPRDRHDSHASVHRATDAIGATHASVHRPTDAIGATHANATARVIVTAAAQHGADASHRRPRPVGCGPHGCYVSRVAALALALRHGWAPVLSHALAH